MLDPDGDIVNGRRNGGGDYFFRQDHHGSVTNIVDSADSVVKSYAYGAYGNTTASGTFVNSFAYTYTGAVIETPGITTRRRGGLYPRTVTGETGKNSGTCTRIVTGIRLMRRIRRGIKYLLSMEEKD